MLNYADMLTKLDSLDSLVRPLPYVVGVHLLLSAKHIQYPNISLNIHLLVASFRVILLCVHLLQFLLKIRWLTPPQTSVKQLGHIEQYDSKG